MTILLQCSSYSMAMARSLTVLYTAKFDTRLSRYSGCCKKPSLKMVITETTT